MTNPEQVARDIIEEFSNRLPRDLDSLLEKLWFELDGIIIKALTLYGNERFKEGLKRAAKVADIVPKDGCTEYSDCPIAIARAIRKLALEEPKK